MADLHPILRIAERQHGLITAAQLHQHHVDRNVLARLIERGVLEHAGPLLYRIGGSAPGTGQQLMAAVLGAGTRAALSHTTGLGYWGVRGFVLDPIHVVRHRDDGDHPVPGVRIHEVRDLPASEVRVLDGIPVVSPALALLQLAGMRGVHPERVGRAVDAAWSDRLVSFRSLDALLARMSQRGRPGLTLLRTLVQERGPDYTPPASNLESRVATLLAGSGLPRMRRQVDSGDGEGWIGRVDFRAEALPVVLEVQSERFHRGLTAQRHDHERLAALRRAGFEVVEASDVDVFHHPDRVLARLSVAFDRAGAARRAA